MDSGSDAPLDGVDGIDRSPTGWAAMVPGLVELMNADPTTLTTAERADGLRGLATLAGQVDAALCTLAGAFDTNVDHAADGARSTVAWLTARTELTRSHATALVHRARHLRPCPTVAAAYRAGAIGTAKVRALLHAREHVETAFARDEAHLVDTITPLTVARAQLLLARWHELALATLDHSPDDPGPNDPADNTVHLTTTFQGQRVLDGTFDPLTGAELHGLLTAEIDRRFASGQFRADDGLLPSQRAATALTDLVRRGSKTSTHRGDLRPSVTVIIDLPTLLGLPTPTTTDALLSHRCELADGTQLPLANVLGLMADATINTVLGHYGLLGDFHPVGEITTTRTATARQRRLLTARDPHCVFPGCDLPAAWTDGHHLDTWHATHQTSVPRLALLCRHHHHTIHRHGHTLTADHEGHVTVTRPNGTTLPTPPPGHQIPPDPNPPPSRWAPLAQPPATPSHRLLDHHLARTWHRDTQALLRDTTRLVEHLEALAAATIGSGSP